jgi:hypothetical protein
MARTKYTPRRTYAHADRTDSRLLRRGMATCAMLVMRIGEVMSYQSQAPRSAELAEYEAKVAAEGEMFRKLHRRAVLVSRTLNSLYHLHGPDDQPQGSAVGELFRNLHRHADDQPQGPAVGKLFRKFHRRAMLITRILHSLYRLADQPQGPAGEGEAEVKEEAKSEAPRRQDDADVESDENSDIDDGSDGDSDRECNGMSSHALTEVTNFHMFFMIPSGEAGIGEASISERGIS